MLENFSIEDKILAFTTDNTTNNDTQTDTLTTLANSFWPRNHIRCFNHTLNLSTKALLKLFYAKWNEDEEGVDDVDLPDEAMEDFLPLEDSDGDDDNNDPPQALSAIDDDDDNIDELDELDNLDKEDMQRDTFAVRLTVIKLRKLAFTILRSPTTLLPAWCKQCEQHGLKVRIFPRDVLTRWNSTHDMLGFAIKYRPCIDSLTGDKKLKQTKI
ncbi:hypothetical protein EI94DRAFT_1852533 [Lactarius quietus]|nr:hypothetical protein EI94DRAFT_1852533 [Lactarius quietus]